MQSKIRISAVMMTVVILATVILSSCSSQTSNQTKQTTTQKQSTTTSEDQGSEVSTKPDVTSKVRVAALKGPTGIGLVKLMADSDEGVTANQYTFSISGSPDDIVAQLTSGQVDIAALPTNLAAALYQKTNQQVRLLAINTLGVLYILERGQTVHKLSDLAGKTIYATGQGAVPEYVLNELLKREGIADQVKIEYKAEHAELATLAASGKADLVMLPEPFVTTVLAKNSNFRIAVDLNIAWEDSQSASGDKGMLAMGCMVVTSSFASDNPAAVQNFLDEYTVSTDYVNANPEQAGQLVAKYQILADAGLAAKAIPNCHIVMFSGSQMSGILDPLLFALYSANPKSIGGSMPEQSFYELP
jgi:NitT/TauT family transport system substrate-binding protein